MRKPSVRDMTTPRRKRSHYVSHRNGYGTVTLAKISPRNGTDILKPPIAEAETEMYMQITIDKYINS